MNLDKKKVSKFDLFIRNFKRTFLDRSKSTFFASGDSSSEPAIHRAFVINLDRQALRWKRFQKEARAERTSFQKNLLSYCERVSAVDGAHLAPEDILPTEIETAYDLKDHYFIDPDPRLTQVVKDQEVSIDLSKAEIAVGLSHLKIWRQIVDERIPYALIFEDDIAFGDNFAEKANKAWQELPQPVKGEAAFDVLYFSYNVVANGDEREHYSPSLFKPVRGLWWLSAYVVSYEGAKKLLDHLPIYGPVDLWLNLKFPILNVFATTESIIGQRKDWGSDNEYSILPLLARAGIHQDEIGLPVTGRKPVFAIGLNKTATTSLHFALTALGYKSCHFVDDDFSDATARLIDDKKPLIYEAYTDVNSVVERFRELDEQYPDAAFIMTTRDLDSWLASRARHVQRNLKENLKGASHTWIEQNPDAWIEERQQHHKAVLSYFSDRPNKLLVLDICGGDRWAPICEFLGCPVPGHTFPHIDPLIKLDSFSRNLARKIPFTQRKLEPGEFDKLPWISKPANWARFYKKHIGEFANRTGRFSLDHTDHFENLNQQYWATVRGSFKHNLAEFKPENLDTLEGGGISMELKVEKTPIRAYSGTSIRTRLSHLYGRFEADIKPAKADGIITALFLFRYNPWQEIDIEFFGRDTTKIMLNVYYNPGTEGSLSNEGVHGTPVVLDLGFDAADDYHHYAIEWDPDEIRWFVDDQLIHVRRNPEPTPIPDLPMQCYFNIWPPNTMKHLAGDLNHDQLPVKSYVHSFTCSSWVAPEVSEQELSTV